MSLHPCPFISSSDAACRGIAELRAGGMVFNGSDIDAYSLRRGFCHHCQTNTATAFLPLSSGHCGNACSVCHALRKGRPYLPKSYLKTTPMPNTAEGENNDTTTR